MLDILWHNHKNHIYDKIQKHYKTLKSIPVMSQCALGHWTPDAMVALMGAKVAPAPKIKTL